MIGHVQGLPGTPNEAQLKSKTLELDQALTKIVMALPGRVLALIDEDFAALGWSMRDNVVTEKFTASNLVAALESMLAKVQAYSPRIAPKQEEIADLSLACSKLWDLDQNRLSPGIDFLRVELAKGKVVPRLGRRREGATIH
jgi:hypothetical protein